ncbi:hypothetical protein ACFLEY_21960 [Bradyrhizobium sp. YCK136]|uniref:hypothetical protein n=1 Tax=Bradyrhizobium sp. YCK136 TaxID=3351346 RepID=UPI0037C94388|nr:hypothetical protein XF16B_45000 [Bradyrhizobium diazoefficiens]BCF70153.1 hypothetical protein XF19B_45060 [Bradyrhizobium diazoefficiens]
MIVLDDWREVAVLAFIAVLLLALVAIFTDATEPTCPAGSHAQHTRSGWYCVVPPQQSK